MTSGTYHAKPVRQEQSDDIEPRKVAENAQIICEYDPGRLNDTLVDPNPRTKAQLQIDCRISYADVF